MANNQPLQLCRADHVLFGFCSKANKSSYIKCFLLCLDPDTTGTENRHMIRAIWGVVYIFRAFCFSPAPRVHLLKPYSLFQKRPLPHRPFIGQFIEEISIQQYLLRIIILPYNTGCWASLRSMTTMKTSIYKVLLNSRCRCHGGMG